MRYWLVMPAAGAGRRFGADLPKQYAPLAGRTVIEWALDPFAADARCAGCVLALAPGDAHWPALAARIPLGIEAVEGGAERPRSVLNALRSLGRRAAPDAWVLVHDAARPCLARADLERLLAAGLVHPEGALLAAPLADTLKHAPGEDAVESTIERAGLWRALTPQMAPLGTLTRALEAALAAGRVPTDESQALEWAGARPHLVAASAENPKITTAADLSLAEAILARRSSSRAGATMRVGLGSDVHAFGPGDSVVLGGVRIAHTHGVIAHSDGDVVLHALCDALLGAAGLGDIGMLFPDTDPQWQGADSRELVRRVLALLAARSLTVVNVDVTVLAESPRLAPCRDEIRRSIAAVLGIETQRVGIKATTTEHLGFIGRSEGLAAQAIVLLDGA